MARVSQPAGTVTLVFTDIEGSTRLLAELGEARYLAALSRHREVVRGAFRTYGGYEVDTEGDSFFYAFASAAGAVSAVGEAMAALEGGPIAIRVGVHTGEPGRDGRNYVGMDVHTAARIMAAGHGGQAVLSQSTRDLLDDSFLLADLGEYRLKDLSGPRRLYQLGAGAFPPLRTLHRTNLPAPASSFVGRERELEELGALLQDGVRLLTLSGPGGSGKTRLALAVVAEAAEAFPDGVWWVTLAAVRDPGLVLSSVALALGVAEEPGRELEETLIEVLSGGRMLLLLDNLEQLLPGAAASVVTLRDAGGATVLVTSRERLRVSGERVYHVAPLAANDAVELFTARTAAIGIDAGDVDVVAELCGRLDNLPLAVELAAARTGLLAPAEILARLGGRLDQMSGDRDADPRQHTLRAAIGWSYDLLELPERELFARLAVFTGGATLDAVEAVCDADLGVLASLLDKSLVRRSGDRVWMLETIREFASERLAADEDADELRFRHAAHYLSLAEASDRESRGPSQVEAFARFVAERDNLRAAHAWLLERDPAAALRLAAALWWFWFVRAHVQEGRGMLRGALARAGVEPTEARASALMGAGFLAWEHGDHKEGFELFENALVCARAAGSRRIECLALSLLAHYAELGQEEQIRLSEEAIAVARASGDRWLLGVATGNHGHRIEEIKARVALYEEACRLCRGVGDASMTALYLSNQAWSALLDGDANEARAKLAEALELAQQIDDSRTVTEVTANLAWAALLEGDVDGARCNFRELATIARQVGKRLQAAAAIWGFAQVAAAEGDALRAARLAGAASALGRPAGYDPVTDDPVANYVGHARATLGDQAWQKAYADGAELDLDTALRLAVDS